jgi:branched-chain amino acid aminotransferase
MRHKRIPSRKRQISVDEIRESKKRELSRSAGAAVPRRSSPPSENTPFDSEKFTINDFKTGPLAKELYDDLTDIQWGKKADPFADGSAVC